MSVEVVLRKNSKSYFHYRENYVCILNHSLLKYLYFISGLETNIWELSLYRPLVYFILNLLLLFFQTSFRTPARFLLLLSPVRLSIRSKIKIMLCLILLFVHREIRNTKWEQICAFHRKTNVRIHRRFNCLTGQFFI